jgi:hypothetical protein
MAHDKCEWKRGEKGERNCRQEEMECAVPAERLPFPTTLLYASRPPVKASFQLAARGLDGARSVMREDFSNKREWQAISWRASWSSRWSESRLALATNFFTLLLTPTGFSLENLPSPLALCDTRSWLECDLLTQGL